MSQQPIWQIVCNSSNKNNTHQLKSLHIFLGSNYKEKLVKKIERATREFIIYCSSKNTSKWYKDHKTAKAKLLTIEQTLQTHLAKKPPTLNNDVPPSLQGIIQTKMEVSI